MLEENEVNKRASFLLLLCNFLIVQECVELETTFKLGFPKKKLKKDQLGNKYHFLA